MGACSSSGIVPAVLPEHDAAAVPGLGVVLVSLADDAAPEHAVLAHVVVLVALGHGVLRRVDVEVVLLLALLVVIHEDARGPELVGVHGTQAAVLLEVRDRGLELFRCEHRLVPADGRLPVGVDGGEVLHGAAAGPAVGIGEPNPGLGDRRQQGAAVRVALGALVGWRRRGVAGRAVGMGRRGQASDHGDRQSCGRPVEAATTHGHPLHSFTRPCTSICRACHTAADASEGLISRLNFW